MTQEEALKLVDSEDKGEAREGIIELQDYESVESIKAIVSAVNRFKIKSITEIAKEILMSFRKLHLDVIRESLACFYCDEPKVRAMAIEVIASFWNDSVDSLDILIKNEDYNMRKYGIDVLSLVTTRKSLEDLAFLVKDKNANVKFSAIEALTYFEAYRDRVAEILEEELEEIDINNMYGVVSIVEAIIKGAYNSPKLLQIASNKIDNSHNNFTKHYIFKLLLTLGKSDILEVAQQNAASAGLLDDWHKHEVFYTKREQ